MKKAPIQKTKEFYYVHKKSMKEYSLMKMTVKGTEVVADEVLHTDVPLIVYAKYIEKLKLQKVDL